MSSGKCQPFCLGLNLLIFPVWGQEYSDWTQLMWGLLIDWLLTSPVHCIPPGGISTLALSVVNGPLTRFAKLRVAHAPVMSETFSPPLRVSDPDMHHGTGVTHVPWCMPGSLMSGILWSRWRRKRSWHSRRMRNPLVHVSSKRLMSSNERNMRLNVMFPPNS